MGIFSRINHKSTFQFFPLFLLQTFELQRNQYLSKGHKIRKDKKGFQMIFKVLGIKMSQEL